MQQPMATEDNIELARHTADNGETDVAHNGGDSDNPFLIPAGLSFSRELLMVLTVCTAQALVVACLNQGLLPDKVIGQTFGVASEDNTWGAAAYALTSGTFVLPAGRIGDIYGHRLCFVVAYIWLAVSSLMTGLSVYSKTFIFYSVCRGLQGIASAMLVPSALAILGSVYKEGPRKNLVFSFYAAGSPVGFTISGIFTAMLAQLAWWPWMFYITTIVCCLLGVISFFAIPKLPGEHYRDDHERQDSSSGKDNRKDFDWLGVFTGVSGLILFNVAWNRAPSVGWDAPDVLATLIIGIFFFVAFLVVENRVSQPLIPVSKLSTEAGLVLATMALTWASFGVLIFYLINFTLTFRHASLLSVAAQFVPVAFAGFAASYLNSFLLGRQFTPSDILAFSTVWFIVGAVLLASLPVHQIYWKQAFWIYVLAPFGMDLSFPSATLVMSKLVPPERQGISASMIATVVYYSQSIGLGIAGTVQAYVSEGNMLKGYRGGMYTGVGLSVFGLVTALGPVIHQRWMK